VTATGARVEEVLDALRRHQPFAVTMQAGVERPPVDVDVRAATLEETLRRVLRQRNYAIAYRETDAGLVVDRVDLLLPRPSEDELEQDSRQARAEAAVRAASQRNEEKRREQAERRFEELRAERQRQREQRQQALAAARAAQRARAQGEPLPLRRLLWVRGR
jgi:hypothetical protein